MNNARTVTSNLATKLLVLLVALPIALLFVTQGSAVQARGIGFQTLDEAVAAGRLDAEVATALRANGSAEAFVAVTDQDLLPDSVRSMPAGQARTREVIATTTEEFNSRKSEVMSSIGSDATTVDEYENLGVSLVEFRTERALLSALNDSNVTGVRTIRTSELQGTQDLSLINQPAAAAAGYRGNGTYVAVLDTGATYSAFGCTAPNVPASCPIVHAQDFATNDGLQDDGGHGTNVAGIVVRVAPGTRIFALDVFKRNAANENLANDADVVNAINQLISWKAQGYNIRAVNLSIGAGAHTPGDCPMGLYQDAFARSLAADIIPVVATGNNGNKYGVAYPSCVAGALSVGAVHDSNVGSASGGIPLCTDWTTAANKITCFSQSGQALSMLAPGSCIAPDCWTGTSQAAPHVAGAVAVLAAAKTTASAAQIRAALVGTGPALTDTSGITRNRLDISAALTALGVGASTDKTAPVVTAPFQEIQFGSAASTVPVRVSWSAADVSGIAQYKVMASTNGGAFTDQLPANSTSTSKTFTLTPGSTYRFIAAAQDKAGNWSGWNYGPTFTVDGVYQENNAAVKYAGNWTRSAWASASGGYVTVSSAANASATFTFTGRNVAWVASKGTNRGQAYVYVDGAYSQTVDLYASTTAAQSIVFGQNWTASGTHTIKVVVVGTTGRPNVDVDGFVVIR